MITILSKAEESTSPSTETTEKEYTATVKCTVTNFTVAERNYTIKQNNTIINASLIYNIICISINNATEFQTKDVQTDIKELFS